VGVRWRRASNESKMAGDFRLFHPPCLPNSASPHLLTGFEGVLLLREGNGRKGKGEEKEERGKGSEGEEREERLRHGF